jgi:dipeptidyl aminopeptidase/acylaminoacyl peptidase
MIRKWTLLFIMSYLLLAQVNARNWEQLFDYSQYQDAKISPDGKYLAVSVLVNNKMALVFVERTSMEKVGSAMFAGNSEVGEFIWVNNERVVIKVVVREPWLEQPQFYGELYAINYDSSRAEMIYGYQAGEMQTGSRLRKKKTIQGWGDIIDVLPNDPNHILIKSTKQTLSGEGLADIYKLDVYTGVIKRELGQAPVPFAHIFTNAQGELIAAVGTDRDNHQNLYLKQDNGWQQVAKGVISNDMTPIAVSNSGKYLYTLDYVNNDIKGLYQLDLTDLTYHNIFTDKVVDITEVALSTHSHSVYAARVDEDYPAYILLDKSEEALVFKDLLSFFPYSSIKITSKSLDGNFYVLYVSSDIDPGTLYLFDKDKNKLISLFKFKPELDNSEFAEMEPLKITASDGKTIYTYFTQAKGVKPGAIAPTVVLVHGGPHGVRDHWQFSAQVQYLALNGYSVLQVNYRGSAGYGRRYELAGNRAWGSLIQQDIYDAFTALVKQQKASKACIMGASFGAYSAIESATLFSDTYQCAVANAGIYDLELMYEEGDITHRRSGLSYLQQAIGTDAQVLKKMSPVNKVNKIKIPLLLAHGEHDKRAPIEHAERLRAALDKEKIAYQWFSIENEGHGFYNPVNQKRYMQQVKAFLDQHLR